jgi:hypothetical protein
MPVLPETIVVHVLVHGLPQCGFSVEVPGNWPKGHSWVRDQKELLDLWYPGGVPCHKCLDPRKAEAMRQLGEFLKKNGLPTTG